MISIKKLLNAKLQIPASDLMRVAALLLEGIAVHAVECDSLERAEFQHVLRRYRRQVEEMAQPGDVLVATGAAYQTWRITIAESSGLFGFGARPMRRWSACFRKF